MNKYSLLLVLLSLTGNCLVIASFDPKLKDIEFKQEGIGSKTIVVSFTEKQIINRRLITTKTILNSQSGKTLMNVCKESSLFKEILSATTDSADIKLHVESEKNAQSIPILNFISIITFIIIPTYEEHDQKIFFSFFDGRGQLIKLYKRRAMDTQLFHILFLPFMYFKYNSFGNDAIFEDVTKSVLDEANRDGLFK